LFVNSYYTWIVSSLPIAQKNKFKPPNPTIPFNQTIELKTKHVLYERGTFTRCHELLFGCMEILFLNIGCHYFWLGLIALPKNTLTYFGPSIESQEEYKKAM
jgi:hypothetical protein